MTVWEFDVAVSTHDRLKRGVTVAAWRRVTVWSESYTDASLAALQLAAADGAMPTDILGRQDGQDPRPAALHRLQPLGDLGTRNQPVRDLHPPGEHARPRARR